MLALAYLICIINILDDDHKPCPNNNNIPGQKMYKRYYGNHEILCTPKDYENIYALNLFTKAILNKPEVAYEIACIEQPDRTTNILRELCCHFFNNQEVPVNLYPYELEFCALIKSYLNESKMVIACKAGELICQELEDYINDESLDYLKKEIREKKVKETFKAFGPDKTNTFVQKGVNHAPFEVATKKDNVVIGKIRIYDE